MAKSLSEARRLRKADSLVTMSVSKALASASWSSALAMVQVDSTQAFSVKQLGSNLTLKHFEAPLSSFTASLYAYLTLCLVAGRAAKEAKLLSFELPELKIMSKLPPPMASIQAAGESVASSASFRREPHDPHSPCKPESPMTSHSKAASLPQFSCRRPRCQGLMATRLFTDTWRHRLQAPAPHLAVPDGALPRQLQALQRWGPSSTEGQRRVHGDGRHFQRHAAHVAEVGVGARPGVAGANGGAVGHTIQPG